MIIDLQRFMAEQGSLWRELEAMLTRLENDLALRLTLDEVRRLHYLYQRASADLARVATFSAEPEMRRYLETLVARAYGHVHAGSARAGRLRLGTWLLVVLPATFRRHRRAFQLAVAMTLVGAGFGGGAVGLDPRAKDVLMPFLHLRGSPGERVRREETANTDPLDGHRGQFAATLMTHNLRVSIFAMAAGMTWGIGTLALLFYNGVILGAICADYILAGEGVFLAGWLLPHGAVEIPAILLGSQAGLVLAGALIGWGNRKRLRQRLREIAPDVITLMAGVALLLAWAGAVESFFSQYHEPVVPYWAKIGFGCVELVLLTLYLGCAGRGPQADAAANGRGGAAEGARK
ncbi:MAG: stage II sporulation protein M [Lentisphaeria bacterium]|nr:stage II sporulation protein M [Lentisphaeria bacterium]